MTFFPIRAGILLFTFFLCTVLLFSAKAYTVTELQATYRNGQVFLTWKNPGATNLQYNVYRSSSPFLTAGDLTTAAYLGYVRDNSAKNIRKSSLYGGNHYFKIDAAGSPLASDRGVYVATCTNNASYYYAVMVVNLSNSQEDKSVINSTNSLTAPVAEMIADPQPVLQVEGVENDGTLRKEYAQWGNNQNASHYPAFTNAGSYAWNFTVFKQGNSTNGSIYVLFLDDNPFSVSGIKVCTDCNVVKIDDRLPNGVDTYWSGWNENYNMYATNNPVATTGVIKMYTQARLKETLEWVKTSISANGNKVYSTGTSHNAFGALLTSQMWPDMITAVFAKNAPVLIKAMNNTEREQQWCDNVLNLTTDYINPNNGMAIPIWDLMDIRHMYIVNEKRGGPFINGINGRQDVTVGWVQKYFWYDTVNVSKQGGTWYWDQRTHNNTNALFKQDEILTNYERFTLARSYPAFSFCSINQNPGDGTPANGDPVGAINGYLDWSDASIVDGVTNYSITCFVKNMYAGGVLLANQYDSCTTNITFRRLQQFQPMVGQTITWEVRKNSGSIVQQGTTLYAGGPITLNGVKIYRSNSLISMSVPSCTIMYYIDADHDGYGSAADPGTIYCTQPAGFVTNNSDCNDANVAINPLVQEVCDANDIDEDCDGLADDTDFSALGKTIYYTDADNDSYGSAAGAGTLYCNPPSGMVNNNGDCNDAAVSIHPVAIELCDANDLDEDCDGLTDETDPSAIGTIIYYVDADQDGYGSSSDPGLAYCLPPAGMVINNNDCNDGVNSIYPFATELCDANDVDEDCNGLADDADPSANGKIIYYTDADNDSYGFVSDPGNAYCNPPAGVVSNNGDCNDAVNSINPSATELCDDNDMDEDCNGLTDDADLSAIGKIIYYIDADLDGYGAPSDTGMAYCNPPAGLVSNNSDCNEEDASIHPAATELCDVNSVDENCNGLADDADISALGKSTYYIDADLDGYGSSADPGTAYCNPPSGVVINNSDCNDAVNSINPSATELCDANDVDEDCNGLTDDSDTAAIGKINYYTDADYDGYGTPSDPGTAYCTPPIGVADINNDCDDANASIHPDAPELCDANDVDEDCNGLVDDADPSVIGKIIYYIDADNDGYGAPSDTGMAYCNPPAGLVSNNNDCNEENASIHPAATELCDLNDVDENCNGLADDADPLALGKTIYYADADADGYGSSSDPGVAYCLPPSGVLINNNDCNDADASIHPFATELCDANDVDEDCNGLTDDSDPAAIGKIIYYTDADYDGYGTPSDSGTAYCTPPIGVADINNDCDDANASIHPAAPELCDANNVDEDCDGLSDDSDSSAFGKINYYVDADLDGYGSSADPGTAYCNPPSELVIDNSDCNDAVNSINPSAIELCDANDVDENCNGLADNADPLALGKTIYYADTDADGYGSSSDPGVAYCLPPSGVLINNNDCNDADASIHPFATELCDVNDVDEDCNGLTDDSDPAAIGKINYYTDADYDGYGTPSDSGTAYCTPPIGVADINNDCDDANASIHPAAPELCDANNVDEDCDGLSDDSDSSALGKFNYYVDADLDGYGSSADPGTAYCNPPSELVIDNSDCNDAVNSINPSATELCDANDVDENCNGLADNADPLALGKTNYYADTDADGYGSSSDPGVAYCHPPSGVVINNSDCNDAEASMHPLATELCDVNDVDEDCNGLTDDSDPAAIGKINYYTDADYDGYGTPSDSGTAYCTPPIGVADINNDCDDANASIHPAAPELCDANNVDEDCDGLSDDSDSSALGKFNYYVDADLDGYGSSADPGTAYCNPPSELVIDNSDCNDAVNSINPSATELCDANDVDENCNGLADNADPLALGKTNYYADTDADGYGSSSDPGVAYCHPPSGVVINNSDCNDAEASMHPLATELCDVNDVDEDCNGLTDDNDTAATGKIIYYTDADYDGYGTPTDPGTAYCNPPIGVADINNDCDDANASIHPDAPELCDANDVDEDCNGLVDDADPSVIGKIIYYIDADNDGYGAPSDTGIAYCNPPAGWVSNNNDCNEGDASIHPAATELCDANGVDENCNGLADNADATALGKSTYYIDADLDSYGSSADPGVAYCNPPSGVVINNSDCNDAVNSINPSATELCDDNDVDEDCNGLVDDTDPSVIGKIIYYPDADLDGYGSPADPGAAYCNPPSGLVIDNSDCNDAVNSINPSATELCDANGVDEDCNGLVDDADPSVIGKIIYYIDTDLDGYGSSADPGTAYCNPPSELVINNSDCNDADAFIHPAATELCDANDVDEDCNGLTDDSDPFALGKISYYIDADLDGYGSSADPGAAYCNPPSELVINNSDCNDAVSSINPSATELCDDNDVDEDCNGLVDDTDPSVIGKIIYYPDADLDGYGSSADPGTAYCNPPSGLVIDNSDCNDAVNSINPSATELCDANGVDEDCNGLVDDADPSVIGKIIFYIDTDLDGYGSSADPGTAYCNPPSELVINNSDCNDDVNSINPSVAELCDANDVDEDCNGLTDDSDPFAIGKISYYIDADLDGYGSSADPGAPYCNPPSELVINNSDCNDAVNSIYPSATELCDANGVDENCNGLDDNADPSSIGKIVYYIDDDQDGYGSSADPGVAYCNPPSGVVINNNDCNDAVSSVNPSAAEFCDANGVDENCNGMDDNADPSAIGKIIYYTDADNDSYGSASDPGTPYCNPPSGVVINNGDCNDAYVFINPSATELCDANDVDEDCNGLTDDADPIAAGKIIYYTDNDNDGYGAVPDAGTMYCNPPAGVAVNNNDCNDAVASINPSATELCDVNGVDENCNGLADNADPSAFGKTVYYPDADQDNYGSSSNQGIAYCHPPSGMVINNSDCNDAAVFINPAATELCDANDVDEDCDGLADDTDPSATGKIIYYADADMDGYGNPATGTFYCNPPAGKVVNNADCNDASAAVKPGATDICDGLDNNCNGTIDENAITVSISPSGSITGCINDLVTFTASGTNISSYKWYKGTNLNPVAGQTNSTYTVNYQNTTVKAVVSNGFGCTATSNVTTITKLPNPIAVISVSNGGNLNLCLGPVNLTIPTGISWQWYRNEILLPGATNNNYTVTSNGNYTVKVFNISGCSSISPAVSAFGQITYYVDSDLDGYGSSSGTSSAYCIPPAGMVTNNSDCNDANASIHPFATELCDANDADEDCDGLADDADPSTTGKIIYYADADNDGYGTSSVSGAAYCNPPSGVVINSTDCNDAAASIHPFATELCDVNDVDEDCNGLADDADQSALGKIIYYADTDNDGFGAASDPGTAYCDPTSGVILNNGDCNDAVDFINPSATELCDANDVDEDCDGWVDDADPSAIGKIIYYADTDNDGYGAPSDTGTAYCNPPSGVVSNNNDCNEADASIHPFATELCDANDVDEDCNGLADDADPSAIGKITYYIDADLDGYGAASDPGTIYCNQPAGTVVNNGDCNDAVAFINPSATELCDANGVDEDCNGLADDADASALGKMSYYIDTDLDGYGSSSDPGAAYCNPPPGVVINNSDCNDAVNSINPSASELCDANGVDEDCNGLTDDSDPSALGKIIYYTDADNDGYGAPSDTGTAYCNPPSGVVTNYNDCNDTDGSVHPFATELCDANNIDEDCNGQSDDSDPSTIGKITYYVDADLDGYGSSADPGAGYCNPPSGLVIDASDCNDADASIHPFATELCDANDADENCDGLIDDDDPSALGKIIYYTDADNDGYGAPSDSGTAYCHPPSGVVINNNDCNDADASIHPLATELCDANDVDEDCNGLADDDDPFALGEITYYIDADLDGYGSSADPGVAYCNPSSELIIDNSDCNDADASIHPSATEICDVNDADENCNGLADDADPAALGKIIYYPDTDNDSYGAASDAGTMYCNAPAGVVINNGDCNDAVDFINPSAAELCDANDVDEDCNGLTDDTDPAASGKTIYYADTDNDSYGAASDAGTMYCNPPPGMVINNGDCNDADTFINPSASELCDANNTDEDCNGLVDDDDPSALGKITYYTDNDNDGYGAASDAGTMYCDPQAGVVVSNGDCNDADVFISPSATEVCDANGVDEDCNGLVDDADPSAIGKIIYYIDADLDGYGSSSGSGVAYCHPPSGVAISNNDCNDADASIHPFATELCDASDVDEDCNGLADEADPSAIGQTIYYIDADYDGYGSASDTGIHYCNPPAGVVINNVDCNDGDFFIHPFTSELCDANDVDEDCDGLNDDSDPSAIGKITYYVDADLDGYGSSADPGAAFCNAPSELVINNSDCNDAANSINPSATEICDVNGIDENCNGLADNTDSSAIGKITYYIDTDMDGYGSAADPGILYCNPPSELVIDNSDCNDDDASIHPFATELCDANDVDEDCNGFSDDADPSAIGKIIYYVDADNDNYGSATDPGVTYCNPPSGVVINKSDCNDDDAFIYPFATELCDANDVDEDCDGLSDDNDPSTVGKTVYYVDADNDGFGAPSDTGIAYCNPPAGLVSNNSDCNEADASINPAATELCDVNDMDENCNGLSDDADVFALGKITYYIDADMDGYGSATDPGTLYCNPPYELIIDNSDCNDADGSIHPFAIELCDANDLDEDCNGLADEDDPSAIGQAIYFIDADNDGYGSASDPGTAYCNQPSGVVSNNDDCNDSDASIHPATTELCDANDTDEDCDGLSDDSDPSAFGKVIYYVDADNDGYGSPADTGIAYCNPPAGLVSNNSDCNEADASINPAATELCDVNDMDENCNGLSDDADVFALGKITYYIDEDMDGYGSATDPGTLYCNPPSELVIDNSDCNDADGSIHPFAIELCDANDLDEDCNGLADEADPSAIGQAIYFIDADNDGYGSATDPGTAYCNQPSGVVSNNDDCNDSDASIHPATTELCDANDTDEDCDGLSDDSDPSAFGKVIYYVDADNDGFGAPSDTGIAYCNPPAGLVSNNSDCNEEDASIHPAATELCDVNDIDENCNGLSDDADVFALGKITYYIDEDMDGYGSATDPGTLYCNPPSELIIDNSDCNDADGSIHPFAIELCDANDLDEDCNGLSDDADPSAIGKIIYYVDADNDNYGSATDPGVTYCNPTSGVVINNSDCNDDDAFIYPFATELCDANDVDEDCNGLSDDNDPSAFGKIIYYIDADNDGFGTPSDTGIAYCNPPAGLVSNNSDCNDANAFIHPAATELCDANGVDEDCDGLVDDVDPSAIGPIIYYADADGDGYGSSSGQGVAYCNPPSGVVTNNIDCNDAVNSIHPSATELCDDNDVDEDCNGLADDADPSVIGKLIYYTDADNDGYGSPSDPGTAYCNPSPGVVLNNSDCNDAVVFINPSAPELCDAYDVDEDCDGLKDDGDPSAMGKITYYVDADNDGYGSPSGMGITYCNPPLGMANNNSDCNELNPSINPSAIELCDANDIDEDCDGAADNYDSFALGKLMYYVDADQDGYGTSSLPGTAYCTPPSGVVTNNTDCVDGNTNVHPGATEICDGIDNNCSGVIDENLTPSNPMPQPVITPVGATSFCYDQSVTLTAQAGFNQYTWSNGKSGPSVTANTQGAITVTVKDGNNCYGTSAPVNLTVWDPPVPIVSCSGPTTYCAENPSTLSTVSGYAYQWKKGATVLGGATNNTYAPSSTGTNYKVTLSDIHGCSKTSENFAVVVNTAATPLLTVTGGTSICQGQSTTITATAGYSYYLWSSGQATSAITVSQAGNYSVTATDANGCSATSAIKTITVNPLPQPVITPSGATSFCNGGSVTLDAGAGYNNYSWSNGKTTQTVNINTSDSYSVTVTNSNGCSGTSLPVTVTVWTPPTPTISTSIGSTTFCANTGVYLTTLSGFSYQWQKSNVNIAGATNQNYTPASGGNYKVIITDIHMCSKTSSSLSIIVNSNPVPVIAGPATVCQGSSATLSCGTFNSYNWSTGSQSSTISINSSGSYTVTVTDGNTCVGTSSAKTVALVPLPTPVITAQGPLQFCDGGTVTLDAGIGYSSYSWSNAKSTQTNPISASGTFTVTVTNSNNCSGTSAPVTVDEWIPPTPAVTIVGPSTYCANSGSTYLTTLSGPYTYQWLKGSTDVSGATNQTFTPSSSGTYKVRIAEVHGCSKTSTGAAVTVNSAPTASISITGSANICAGQTKTITANSGSGLTYLWKRDGNNISGATASAYIAALAGNYTCVVTNSNGCSTTSNTIAITSNCKGDEQFEKDEEEVTWLLYPNPTSGDLHIRLNLGGIEYGSYQAEIRNVLGGIIWRKESSFTDHTIEEDVYMPKSLADGAYFVIVRVDGHSYHSQFIVQKE